MKPPKCTIFNLYHIALRKYFKHVLIKYARKSQFQYLKLKFSRVP